jgi:hypothetical protein
LDDKSILVVKKSLINRFL